MAENERQALVKESDHAYDKVMVVHGTEFKVLTLLEVLVAEARLARYDREHPMDLAAGVIDDFLGAFGDDEETEDE